MITKRQILQNVQSFSPQELADAVRNGVVSLYDLNTETNGYFTARLKRQVKEILEGKCIESASVNANKDSVAAVEQTVFAAQSLDETFSFEVVHKDPMEEKTAPYAEISDPKAKSQKNKTAFGVLFILLCFLGCVLVLSIL